MLAGLARSAVTGCVGLVCVTPFMSWLPGWLLSWFVGWLGRTVDLLACLQASPSHHLELRMYAAPCLQAGRAGLLLCCVVLCSAPLVLQPLQTCTKALQVYVLLELVHV
jgi:hypothetical protein